MPYKDPDKQRKFQREWLDRRKERVFKGKKCEWCGAEKNLTLHHRDPEQKIDHRIWSWEPKRFLKELKKCDIICKDCHEKHNSEVESKPDKDK